MVHDGGNHWCRESVGQDFLVEEVDALLSECVIMNPAALNDVFVSFIIGFAVQACCGRVVAIAVEFAE